MIDAIKIRILQGDPIIHDVRNVKFPLRYRGLPNIHNKSCSNNCSLCKDSCPTEAITLNPIKINIGKCIFCPVCEEICPEKIINFSNNYKLGVTNKEHLIVDCNTNFVKPEVASQKIRDYFGKSLKLRQISAAGCNGCELELNALSNVNFDMGRYGIEFVASPRHADGVVITGPISKNMAEATKITYEATPNPKIIILFGACAISGGIFNNSTEIDRSFLEQNKIDLFVPGCPPHPLTFINALLDYLDRK
ncbi:MAG TPA: hypothetical protein PL041_10275 [Melioribacteraceae bacterium]|nr:hypothetical protein [Melioribacteraceae bacterium]